jgi:hypothetical protein
VSEQTPNTTLIGGPWPNRKVYWSPEKKESMVITYAFNKKGKYVRASADRALWEDIK